MKKVMFFIILLFISLTFCTERYKDPVFKTEKILNLVYAEKIPHLKQKHFVTALTNGLKLSSDIIPKLNFYQSRNTTKDIDLRFNLYQPKIDSIHKRPLIIVVHGGAFISGSKDDKNQPIIDYCDSLSSRGYVVASIDYRIGLILNSVENQLVIDSLDLKRAIQWGVQDLERAVLYFKNNAEQYKIDADKIFVMGNSSGAVLALHFAMEKEINVKGVVSLWGGVLNKNHIKNIMTPVLFIHGESDEIIPFKEGRIMDLNFIKEENRFIPAFTSIISAFDLKFFSPIFYGGGYMASVLKESNKRHKTYFLENTGHEFYYIEPHKKNVLIQIIEFLNENLLLH